MGDNKISEAARKLAYETGMWYSQNEKCQPGVPFYAFTQGELDRFVEKLSHLQGEAVPVGYVDLVNLGAGLPSEECFYIAWQDKCTVPVYLHPQPAELSEAFNEALAVGDGTVGGAVVYWHQRALAAEAKLSEVGGDCGEVGMQQVVWNDSARLACLESWAREPDGLLLHAESETGRRGLGLGENCGNRTLAQAIDGCATNAEKNSFAALAANGKQQVGEAQMSDITVEWVLGYLDTDLPERSRDAVRDAFAEYHALASRQPVGQGPAEAKGGGK